MKRSYTLLLCGMVLLGNNSALSQSQPNKAILNANELRLVVENWSQRTGKIAVYDPASIRFDPALFGANTTESVLSALNELPVLHIVVSPAPPRDYSVIINGRNYPATERSEYAVSRDDTINVVVTRSGRTPCKWGGRVYRRYELACQL